MALTEAARQRKKGAVDAAGARVLGRATGAVRHLADGAGGYRLVAVRTRALDHLGERTVLCKMNLVTAEERDNWQGLTSTNGLPTP